MGRILAIDYGLKRTGIAVTDELQLSATPLVTIATADLLVWMKEYVEQNNIKQIIVGYPFRTQAGDNSIMVEVDRFIERCVQLFPNIDVNSYDERYTSSLAHRAVVAGGVKKSKRRDKALYDKLAACILLEDYLQYKHNTITR